MFITKILGLQEPRVVRGKFVSATVFGILFFSSQSLEIALDVPLQSRLQPINSVRLVTVVRRNVEQSWCSIKEYAGIGFNEGSHVEHIDDYGRATR